MSDYMFMLESHLGPNQSRAVAEIEAAAGQAGVNLFLTGGAMRDMLGGFPIRDLDFTVEGDAIKLAKALAKRKEVRVLSTDTLRKTVELLFPAEVTAEIGMARKERYPKPGGRPQVQPASIHEDLSRRDFTVNAIALSLNPASRGLLLDPNNGLADLEHRELRATGNYTFYDDPSRLLRLIRLQVRLGFTIHERTRMQYENARQAELENRIPRHVLFQELRHIASEQNSADMVAALNQENLMALFSPALVGAKLNLHALAKLQKARQLIPYWVDLHLDNLGLFLYFLAEKLTPKEKAALAKDLTIAKPELESWQKLEARSKPLEKELKSPKLHKPSQVYQALRKAPGDQVLFLYLHSSQRLVHDRIRNYLQKYLISAQEITDREVAAAGAPPGSPQYQKVREELILARLDGRTKKPAPPAEPEAAMSTTRK